MKNNKLPASLEGLLEKIQQTFIDLDKQEKRALGMIKRRDDEIIAKKEESNEIFEPEDVNVTRTLKEIEVIDALHNNVLNLINNNNKNKIELIKYYGNVILKSSDQIQDTVEEQHSEGNFNLTEKDLTDIRNHIKFNVKTD